MKRNLLILFLLFTFVNLTIYLFKDHFQYIKYSTYNDLYSDCNDDCQKRWETFLPLYSASNVAEAKKVLQLMEISASPTTLDKIKRIGQHLYTSFHTQQGFPKDTIHKSDPLTQYKILKNDSTQKLWCGTWAGMFAYFCVAENIVGRYVEIFKPGDHHVLNECYLPEVKKWVMVDLTNDILLVEKNGQPLNFQEFLHSPSETIFTDAITLQEKILNNLPYKKAILSYYKTEYPACYCHITNAQTVYKPAAKLKRYFFPGYWCEIYSDTSHIAWLFYVKIFFIAGWLVLGSLILFKRFT